MSSQAQVARLRRYDSSVPVSAGWRRGMLMDQLPFTVPSLEGVCFAHRHLLGSAVFEDDVYPLYRTDDPHVAVQHYFGVEDVHVTGLEARKYTIEHFSCGLNAFRREWRNVVQKCVRCPMPRALGSGHRFCHFFDDGNDGLFI